MWASSPDTSDDGSSKINVFITNRSVKIIKKEKFKILNKEYFSDYILQTNSIIRVLACVKGPYIPTVELK
jgi:hypothetical protein